MAMGEMRLEGIVDGGAQRTGVAVPRQASISDGGSAWCQWHRTGCCLSSRSVVCLLSVFQIVAVQICGGGCVLVSSQPVLRRLPLNSFEPNLLGCRPSALKSYLRPQNKLKLSTSPFLSSQTLESHVFSASRLRGGRRIRGLLKLALGSLALGVE